VKTNRIVCMVRTVVGDVRRSRESAVVSLNSEDGREDCVWWRVRERGMWGWREPSVVGV
jgi:hypothetical protein